MVRTCVVVSEERPRTSLLSSFAALFSPLGLASHTVSASFGCRVNPVICLQGMKLYMNLLFLYYVDSLHKINIDICYATTGPQHPEPSSVYVDQRALRVDRVTVLERGAPHSVCLMECGKVSSQEHYTTRYKNISKMLCW